MTCRASSLVVIGPGASRRASRIARVRSPRNARRAAVEIADRAYVLDDGRVVFSGAAAAEFAKDEERVRALTGASPEAWSDAQTH